MREGCDDTFDLDRAAQVDWAYLDADRWRDRLDDSELANSLSSASLSENSRCVTLGAISLSSSNHFPHKLYSNIIKPVALAPGCDRLSTKPDPTGRER